MFKPSDHTFAVCAYGESPYLEECIRSLLAQSLKTNILISTSTPNEHIATIAKKYEIKLYINSGAPSISHDWNCALSHAKTRLVTVAHQDDVYLPDFSGSVVKLMAEENSPLIAFTDYGEIRNGKPDDRNRLLNIKRAMLAPLKTRRLRGSRFARRRILSFGSAICCPSVTFCVPNLPSPVFLDDMKCDLDWEAWERFSRMEGSFLYVPTILMRHRIHGESETTALIGNDTRSREDLEMLERFWPKSIASFINRFYSSSQRSNEM